MKSGWKTFSQAMIGGFLVLVSSLASADCAGGQGDAGQCVNVKTTLLYIDANEDAYINVDGNASALSCTASGGLLRLPKTSANFNSVYATLLAAHISSRSINVRLVPSNPQCTIAYVTMPG